MISQKWFSYFELRSRKSDLNNLLKIILMITIRGHSQGTTGRPERGMKATLGCPTGEGILVFGQTGEKLLLDFQKCF